jgi:RNA polymerase sigma-70 factor (ECF subfamily)
LKALDRAEALGGRRGSYQLQAAIAACHGRARKAAETDWTEIANLYDELAALHPSPVIELNRSVAYAMAYGPEAGLEIADGLLYEPTLENYHLLPSVRGDFLFKLGRLAEARSEFERAAAMTRNEREKTFLLGRAAASGAPN